MGHVLNNYGMKGPKVLNDLISVLLKYRENQIALVGDMSKMYSSVRLSTHTHTNSYGESLTQLGHLIIMHLQVFPLETVQVVPLPL